MHLILFVVAIIISVVVVMIGSIAFELTGLEKSAAKFQALSCFTGTGFTTKESEQITLYPVRRRIAMFLMILGNAGFVTMIATFANSLSPHSFILKFESSRLTHFFPSMLGTLFNLAVLGVAGYFIYKASTNKALIRTVGGKIRKYLSKENYIKEVPFEELFLTSAGYGVVRIDIQSSSPLLNRAISQTPLSQHRINILTLERNDTILHNPPADTRLDLDDRIVCFGDVKAMQSLIG